MVKSVHYRDVPLQEMNENSFTTIIWPGIHAMALCICSRKGRSNIPTNPNGLDSSGTLLFRTTRATLSWTGHDIRNTGTGVLDLLLWMERSMISSTGHSSGRIAILVAPFFMKNVTYILGNLKHIGSGHRTCQMSKSGGYPCGSNGSSKLSLGKMFQPVRLLFNACYPTSHGAIIDGQIECPMVNHPTCCSECPQTERKELQTGNFAIRDSQFILSAEWEGEIERAQELVRRAISALKKKIEESIKESIAVTLDENLDQTDRGVKYMPRYITKTAKGARQTARGVADSSTSTAGITVSVDRHGQVERNRPHPRPAMISPDDDDDDDTIGFHRASCFISCKVSTSNRHPSSNRSQNFLRSSISSNKPYVHKSTWKPLPCKCNDAMVINIWRTVIARTCGQISRPNSQTIAWTLCAGVEDHISDTGMHQTSPFVSVA